MFDNHIGKISADYLGFFLSFTNLVLLAKITCFRSTFLSRVAELAVLSNN